MIFISYIYTSVITGNLHLAITFFLKLPILISILFYFYFIYSLYIDGLFFIKKHIALPTIFITKVC